MNGCKGFGVVFSVGCDRPCHEKRGLRFKTVEKIDLLTETGPVPLLPQRFPAFFSASKNTNTVIEHAHLNLTPAQPGQTRARSARRQWDEK